MDNQIWTKSSTSIGFGQENEQSGCNITFIMMSMFCHYLALSIFLKLHIMSSFFLSSLWQLDWDWEHFKDYVSKRYHFLLSKQLISIAYADKGSGVIWSHAHVFADSTCFNLILLYILAGIIEGKIQKVYILSTHLILFNFLKRYQGNFNNRFLGKM